MAENFVITINIPDTDTSGAAITPANWRRAVSNHYAYQTTILNPNFNPAQPESQTNPRMISNPQSRADFIRQQIKRILREAFRAGDREERVRAAEQAVIDVDINVS
jgi:hypothetical protein